jgi:hypothetical protein
LAVPSRSASEGERAAAIPLHGEGALRKYVHADQSVEDEGLGEFEATDIIKDERESGCFRRGMKANPEQVSFGLPFASRRAEWSLAAFREV